MRLYPQHRSTIRDVLHKEPNDDDFHDVTALFKNIKKKQLRKSSFITEVSDGCYIIDIPYLGVSFKYALFVDTVDVWVSDMPEDKLRTLLASTGFQVEPCESNMSSLGEHKLNKQAALIVAAMLHKLPYPICILCTGIRTELSYSDGVILIVTPAYTFRCDLSKADVCNMDLKQLAIFLRGVVPMSYSINGGDDYLWDKEHCVDVDYSIGVKYYVRNSDIVVYKKDVFQLSTNPAISSTVKEQINTSCAELLDTYLALLNDGEFSKHVVQMLGDLEVPVAKVEAWLQEKIDSLK